MEKDLKIRSSINEFITFKLDEKDDSINVKYFNETLWLTQQSISELFDVDRTVITKHINNILDTELDKDSVCAKFAHTASDGKKYQTLFYNLDMIISVGYKVNSNRAIQFRKWSIEVIRNFTIKGYVIDKQRMENGSFLNEDYFEKLLQEIREIRLSERKFYQKITDIFATSVDYDNESKITVDFFKKIQNKMHYAITKNTAAEIIKLRADSTKDNMGLTSWKNSPEGKILPLDVIIAKNYLSKEELDDLGRIVNAFLELAEGRAKRQIPMTMEDWITRVDKYLLSDDRDVLKHAGEISMQIAKEHALSEFEKYRVIQDKLYKSDFDLLD